MIDAVLQLSTVAACVVIIVRTDPAINRMCRSTREMIRQSILLLQVGATAEIGSIMLGRVPAAPEALVLCGAALLLVCERRVRILVPRPRKGTTQ